MKQSRVLCRLLASESLANKSLTMSEEPHNPALQLTGCAGG